MDDISRLENWYLSYDEPVQGCLLALRHFILNTNELIEVAWKWGGPFFYYRGRVFCYLWVDRKTKDPYIGFYEGKHLEHPKLEFGDRTRIKAMHIDPNEDLPVMDLKRILNDALDLYRKGIIKTKK